MIYQKIVYPTVHDKIKYERSCDHEKNWFYSSKRNPYFKQIVYVQDNEIKAKNICICPTHNKKSDDESRCAIFHTYIVFSTNST